MLINVGQLLARPSSGTRSSLLIGGGNDGFAFDATDLSVWIKDSGTPANDYNVAGNLTGFSAPFTYTSPSPKMIRHGDGLIKYNAHNLYLNSASPANQAITVVSGATYAVAITGTVSVTASGAATGTWTAGTNTFTAATTTLTLGSTSGSGTVHVYRTPADSTYVATTGAVKYLLPVEYDTDGARLGVLVEPQATDLSLSSSDFANVVNWTAVDLTVSAAAGTAPNGETDAHLVYPTTSGGDRRLAQGPATTAVDHTVSFYAKYAGISYCYVMKSDGSAPAAWWNVQTGAVGTVAASHSATITDVGNGWYRCTVTGIGAAGSAYFGYWGLSSADNSVSVTANSTDGILLWNYQVEAGTVATSPIETFSATVTRAIDLIKLPESECTFSDSAGTLYAVFTTRDPVSASRIVQLNNGDGDDYVDMFVASGALGSLCDGASVDVTGDATVSADTETAVAYGFTNGDQGIAIDGTIQLADAEALSVSFDRLHVGNSAGASQAISGHIKVVMYRPVRLANATLETLTGA